MKLSVFITRGAWMPPGSFTKTLRIMKFTALLLFVACLQTSASSFSQTVSLSLKNASLPEVFAEVKKQTGLSFIWDEQILKDAHPVSIDVKNVPFQKVLELCLDNQQLTYRMQGEMVVIGKKKLSVFKELNLGIPDLISFQVITGVVKDEEGVPIVGASVMVKGTKFGTVTNEKGEFRLESSVKNVTLVVSSLGYASYEVKVIEGVPVTVVLKKAEQNLDEVVVTTGMFERRKENFTGAAVAFKGDELKMIGNQNVLQSLKSLDPSFIITENNLLGSNPNALPDIEIRGKTSISNEALRDEFAVDPNQPLFILDGFETTLRVIMDLDMNRVESITLLKDAASTAIYGARAANGVVVVETKRPKPGSMQLYYTGDFRIEMPDLRDYNLMNAEEKLEFERLSGRYTAASTAHSTQLYLDSLYAARLAQVRRGVNTYWLSEPVQIGFTNNHSIRADGGDEVTRYGLGLQYKKVTGAMKGSGRDTWGANFDIIYRKGKFNVTNKFYANGYTANESPYGSFSTFAKANPYYKKRNDDGMVTRYLEIASSRLGGRDTVANPLYDALLNNFNTTKTFSLQNNIQLVYRVNDDWQVQGSVQLNKESGRQEIFYSPDHSMFLGKGTFERGKHTSKNIEQFGYQANLMLSYGKLFNGVHQLTGNLRAEIQEKKNEAYSAVAVGFPQGTNGNPAFAFGYPEGEKPSTAYSQYRRNNVLFSGSYTYDRRYVVDFSYRLDGSTSFGVNKKYSPFWSVGLGWNLHNDRLSHVEWLDVLRLKANVGLTGNQNFGGITSVSVYSYESPVNNHGQGVTLSTLGNPDLEWQNTLQYNIGLDITAWNNRFSGFVNAFRKYTDPLIVLIDLPSSTGIYSYPKNVGNLTNNGLEANLSFSPIYKPQQRVMWTIGYTAMFQKAVYGGLNNELESLNKVQQESNSLQRYRDGYSPEDIWAVYSYGIDPATGMELFRRVSDGLATFDYSGSDIVRVGNTRPVSEGVISNRVTYKGLNVSFYLRYRFGGDFFNTALYNKVENITDANISNNQDKRALYDRWKQPGDVAQFKSIGITGAGNSSTVSSTPRSSRFVQEENTLIGESISIGYDFYKANFVKALGIKTLKVNAFMNDIFRISSILRERGIDYPFARAVAFSINATF